MNVSKPSLHLPLMAKRVLNLTLHQHTCNILPKLQSADSLKNLREKQLKQDCYIVFFVENQAQRLPFSKTCRLHTITAKKFGFLHYTLLSTEMQSQFRKNLSSSRNLIRKGRGREGEGGSSSSHCFSEIIGMLSHRHPLSSTGPHSAQFATSYPLLCGYAQKRQREHIQFMLDRDCVHSWNILGCVKRQKSQTTQLLIVLPDIGFP